MMTSIEIILGRKTADFFKKNFNKEYNDFFVEEFINDPNCGCCYYEAERFRGGETLRKIIKKMIESSSFNEELPFFKKNGGFKSRKKDFCPFAESKVYEITLLDDDDLGEPQSAIDYVPAFVGWR